MLSTANAIWKFGIIKPERNMQVLINYGAPYKQILLYKSKHRVYMHMLLSFYSICKFLYEQVIHNIISIKANVSGKAAFPSHNQFSVICHA